MPIVRKLLVFVAILELGGCVAQQQATMAPRPFVAAPVQGRFLNKTVLAGTRLEADHVTSINPDCTIAGHVTVRVTQEPVHGTIQVIDGEMFPSYPSNNPRSACNTRKVPATVIDYTPASGFVGSDFFVYEIFGPDGSDVSTKAAIAVK